MRIIKDKDRVIAIIVKVKGIDEERKFITPDDFPLQVGFHSRKAGSVIKPHVHIPFDKLENLEVQEIFYILSGLVKITLYDQRNKVVEKIVLGPDDLIVINCGHGVEFEEDSKLFEIKQGPYRGFEGEKKVIS